MTNCLIRPREDEHSIIEEDSKESRTDCLNSVIRRVGKETQGNHVEMSVSSIASIGSSGNSSNTNSRVQEVYLPSTHSKPNPNKTASSLGLDAPFRSFDHRDNTADLLLEVENPVRKRRRSISSLSFHLETAQAIDARQVGETDCERRSKSKVVRHIPKSSDGASQFSDLLEPSNEIASPEKPMKNYERKLRHKTREDCYKLKQVNSPGKKTEKKGKKENNSSKKRKRKRKEKSGTALMHEFTAQNVAPDRLTLHSAPKLGIFTKGRASSPFRRGGLPDLAFSEVTFLNSRKERSDIPVTTAEKKSQRKRDKNADTEAEISRYFTSTKSLGHREAPPGAEPALESSHQKTQYEGSHRARKFSKRYNPSISLVGLPEMPFLGFGSSGAPITSPEMRFQMVLTPNWATQTQSQDLSPTRSSTTYYTWLRTKANSSSSTQQHSSRSIPSGSLPHQSHRNSLQCGESLGQHDTNNNNYSQEISHIDQSRVESGISGSSNREVARDDQNEKLTGQMAKPAASQPGNDDLAQDMAASAVAKPSDKGKTQTPVEGNTSGNTSVDEGPVADNILRPISGPHGLSTQMPLSSFDAVLETLIKNRKGSISQPPQNAAYEANTDSGVQLGVKNASSCNNLGVSESVRNGVSISENENDHMPSKVLAPNYVAPQPSEKSVPQVRRSPADRVQHSFDPCPSTSCSGRKPTIRKSSYRRILSRESDGPTGNDGAANIAQSAWSGYDHLYEQQMTPEDTSWRDSREIHGHAPMKTKDFDNFVDYNNEATDLENYYKNYPNLENASFPNSQEYYQRLQSEENLGYYLEKYHNTNEPDFAFHLTHNGVYQDEDFLQDENQSLEEVFLYPSSHKYARSDINKMKNNPLTQTEQPDSFHSWDLASRHQADEEDLQQNEEVPIPGFWKPNKLY